MAKYNLLTYFRCIQLQVCLSVYDLGGSEYASDVFKEIAKNTF